MFALNSKTQTQFVSSFLCLLFLGIFTSNLLQPCMCYYLEDYSDLVPSCLKDYADVDGVIYTRCIQNGTIALTFDDGPNPRNNATYNVLATLAELDVPATFFVNGANYAYIGEQAVQEILHQILLDGHSIGNHAWSHPNLTELDNNTIIYQLEHLSKRIESVVSIYPTIMRPPFGAYNQRVIDIVNGQLGYKVIMWGISSCDWSDHGNSTAALRYYQRILHGTVPEETPGFITLHHDPIYKADELAANIIQYVRQLGYRLISLEECLGL